MSDARLSLVERSQTTRFIQCGRLAWTAVVLLSGSTLLADGTAAMAAWDISVSGFGGYSVPFKTDIRQTGLATDFTGKDGSLKNSASYGGKITAWTTAPRRRFGLDFGAEIDVTRFSPSIKSQTLTTDGTLLGIPFGSSVLPKNAQYGPIDISATTIAVNFLVRKPFGVTKELPMGRWYPYVGVGGGIQIAHASGNGIDDSDKSGVIQVPAGLKFFITRHIALFGEYKYIHASHTFKSTSFANEVTIANNNFVAGIAIHFN